MTLLGQFVALLGVHWLGDFVLQSHWMSINKSKRIDALAVHVAIYAGVLWFASILLFGQTRTVLVFVLVNGAAHFATDFVTSRITSYLWSKERVHDFFVVVGVDQLMHQVTLAATLVWIMAPSI